MREAVLPRTEGYIEGDLRQQLTDSTNNILPTPPPTQNPSGGTQPDAALLAEIDQLKAQLHVEQEKSRRKRTKRSKRKRAPSPTHSDSEEPAATRPRTDASTGPEYHEYGCVITRAQGCYLDVEAIILHGIKVDTDEDYNEREESPEAQTMTADWRWFCGRFLNLQQTILSVSSSLKTIEDIAEQISTGMDSARNDDRNTLRGCIMAIIKQPQLAKEQRGFRSVHTSALLLPLSLVHRAGEPSLHDEVVDGRVRIVSEQLPAFLFPPGQKNDASLLANLLTSDILIQAAKVVYHGPGAMFSGDGCRGKGKDGNAERIGLKAFTPRLVAYVACQVRFALSSVTTYNKIDGQFDYEKFFNYILKALGRQETEERVVALFNRRVLGVTPSGAASTSAATDGEEEGDPLEQMWAAADMADS
ncbi:hypothetical protein C8F01DRAFT_1261165 [Mycena amicta]|nr:hypothetical protein C8F01DRAFT_1261165 [Mycena amicta]